MSLSSQLVPRPMGGPRRLGGAPACDPTQAQGAPVDGTGTALVVHPRWAGLLAERERLRQSLAALLERLTDQQRRAEYLEAVFHSRLGRYELERLEAQAEHASLRAQLAAAQAFVNRGQRLDQKARSQAKAAGAEELARWQVHIAAQQSRLSASALYLRSLVSVTPEVVAEVKRLYRRLCLHLHPDLAGADNPLFARYWPMLQQAYRSADLELMRLLDRLVPETAPRLPDSWDPLLRSIEAMRRQERELLVRLADNKTRPH
jgi:ribosome biogenesis protein Nip4